MGEAIPLEYTTLKPARKVNRAAAVACRLGLAILAASFVVFMMAGLCWPSRIMWAGAIGCAAGGMGTIICGIIGLRESCEVNTGGRGAAVVGSFLGLMSCGMMGMAMDAMIWDMPMGQRENAIHCGKNLRLIGQGLMLYAKDHQGEYPDTLSPLITEIDVTLDIFTCVASEDERATGPTPQAQAKNLYEGKHLSYVYLRPQGNGAPPANAVLAYEPLSNHHGRGMNVLFGDGHVEWFTGARARRVIDQLRAGINPPSTQAAGGAG